MNHLAEVLSLVKKENPDIIFSHCFLHKAQDVKSLDLEIEKISKTIVKMVNSI